MPRALRLNPETRQESMKKMPMVSILGVERLYFAIKANADR
tara:strand:+ start:499 stop:621 length:123 start_codon:yes stop_codon:yes gene_type:complete